ncbi:MAG TPA: BTAD domain-containing putative transcriptional regulator [Gemmatimonadales bacterium]|nr:BTAD domain-containing putative transcriptional regulator [Gemmatimonadales bacterium]
MFRLRVLGGFALEGPSGTTLSPLPRRRAEATLAVLAVCGDLGCTRERLIALLWPESDEARARQGLRDALANIRHALGPDAVSTGGDRVRLDPAVVGSDALAFSQALAAGRDADAAHGYGGLLLDGFHVDDAPDFERWLDGERSRLAREYAEALERLAEAAERAGAWGEAAGWWARAEEHDPLNSHLALRHAEALVAAGDRANAIKVADAHARRLRDELGLSPDAAFVTAFGEIRRGQGLGPRAPAGAPAAGVTPSAVARPAAAGAEPASVAVPVPDSAAPSVSAARRRRALAYGLGGAALLIALGILAQLLPSGPPTITATDVAQVTNALGVQWQPAISPDGKEVAYVANAFGRAYVAVRSTEQEPGGAELRLSDSSFLCVATPAWTARGDFVRFMGCTARVWRSYETGRLGGAADLEALPAPAGRCCLPGFSPDDARIAFSVGHGLLVARVAGAAPHLIGFHPWGATGQISLAAPRSFAWSPDGRLIAYVYGTGPGASLKSSIWVVGAAGGTPRAVTDADHVNESPAWLDARHLLFVSDRSGARAAYVVEVGPDGARGAARSIPGVADPYSISYAAAARKVAWAKYSVRQDIWSYPLGRPAAISIRDGERVTTGNELTQGVDLSPDGKWLAFSNEARGGFALYRMPVSGGDAVRLTGARWHAWGPRWSPDGREIAFFASERDSSPSVQRIMVVSAAGGEPVALTGATGISNDPAWSPDGLHIAFQAFRGARSEAWIVSRDSVGGAWHGAVQVTHTGCFVRDWAPDGSGVLCDYLDPPMLTLVSPEGRVLWRRDVAPFGLTYAQFARFSRDGRTVYLESSHRDGRHGIWAVPVAGGPPRPVILADDPGHSLPIYPVFSVGRDRLYVPVREPESNIWVAKLQY